METSSARFIDDHIELSCPKCDATEIIDCEESHRKSRDDKNRGPTPPIKGDEASSDDLQRCPKCGSAKEKESRTCEKCGLVFKLWVEPSEAGIPEHIVTIWKKLDAQWDDDELHQQFIQACFEVELLSFAARHYRSRPDSRSKKQLEKITILGMQAMQAAEVPSRLDPKPFRIVGWALFVILLLGVVVFFGLAYLGS